MNSKKDTTGIKRIKRKDGYKYQSRISINGKYHHLGTFGTFDEAYKARQETLKQLPPRKKVHYVKKNSLIDLTGQKFGHLTAIKRLPYNGKNNNLWLCQCDCGNTTEVPSSALTRGVRTSCGAQIHQEEHTKPALKALKDKFYVDNLAVGRIDSSKIKRSKRNTTGVTGVSPVTRYGKTRYSAEIQLNHVKMRLGTFDTIEEAKNARLEAEKKILDAHPKRNK